MVSRDVAIHLSAIMVAFAVLFAASMVAPAMSDPVYVVALLAFYGLVFGGAHAYLAWRGESGMVPVDARWRYVLALLVVLALGAVGALGPNGDVAGVSVDVILFIVAGIVTIAYFLAEGRAGYRERRPS